MIKAVIFDMDGVILNSEPLHFEADFRTMREFGMELPEEVFVAYVGTTGPEMWGDLIVRYGIPDTLDGVIARQKAHKLRLLAETQLEAITGVIGLLQQVKHAGLRIGLASSSPRYFIEAVIENLGISGCFEAVLSGEEVPRGKPDPAIFLKTAELLGVKPQECLVIEDSSHGVSAAKAAGMRCVGYVNPTSGEQDLSMADAVINDFISLDMIDLES